MTITAKFIFSQYARFWKDLYFSAQVRTEINRTKAIKRGDVLLLACHDQWDESIAHFCNYYRSLGVSHFLFIDYGKSRKCKAVAKDMDDVSVFSASGKFRRSANGNYWRNIVLRRFAQNNFCVLADPGEYLVFPFMEDRKIGELADFLKNERKHSLHGIVIDAYARDPKDLPASLEPSADPFALCPYFDKDGYYHRNLGESIASVIGGPALRLSGTPEPTGAPVLNKVVGVWWDWHYFFTGSGRALRPVKLMRIFDWKNPVISVAMFRFPQIAARLNEIPLETMIRTYGKETANAVATGKTFYLEGVSTTYQSSSDLMEMGLISSGNWI